jgi:hypothetical protein
MKRLFALLFAATAWAAPTVSTNVDLVSAYTFRGAQLAAGSAQPSVTAEWGDCYGTVWANRSFQPAESSEVDFTLGGGLGAFDAGITAYTYPGRDKTTWEPYVGASVGERVKGSLYVYRDTTLRVTTFEGKAAVKCLATKRFEGAIDAALGTSRGRDLPAYTYWSGGPTFKTQLGRFGLTAGVQYVSSNDAELKRDLWVSKIGLSF